MQSTTPYAARSTFLRVNANQLTLELLTDVADDCVKAADYSPRHARYVLHTVTYSHDDAELLRLLWNACTWAGLNPQRQIDNASNAAAEQDDRSDYIEPADDARYEEDGRSDFDLVLIDTRDWNHSHAQAGDCDPDALDLFLEMDADDFEQELHALDVPAPYWS